MDKVWNAVREIKLHMPKKHGDVFYLINCVGAVEQKLLIGSTKIRYKNMTTKDLQIAAEMFLYLNSCPEILKPWIVFYKDLFGNQPANVIVLTLNRMLKADNSSKNEEFKNITKVDFFVSSVSFALM